MFHHCERLDQRLRPHFRQVRGELTGGHVRRQVVRDLVQNGTGIHSGIELHDRHAGGFVAADDGPLDRRRAAQAGQQRRMDVHHATARQLEQLGLENVAIRDHHPDVRLQVAQAKQEPAIGRLLGLKDGQIFGFGGDLDRWRNQCGARATLGCVGLCDDGDDVEPFTDESAERRDREFRSAEEGHAHL